MTDEANFCVDPSHKHGPKRCNSCGKPVKAQSTQPEVQVSPESLAKFKSFIEDMISDGEDPLDDMDSLYEAAEDLGVPKQVAAQVIVELSSGSNEDNLELKLFYDTSVANMGVANGNSILSLRLENSSPKSFEKILIEFKHPEEQTPVIFEPVKSLGKGKTKQVETSLKLNLVGQHSIKDGEIRIFALNGSVQVFRLASSIRMSAENSQVSKNTSNVTNVRNETHGGGVIDASRFGGGGTSGSAQLDVWEFVRLKKVNAKDQGTMDSIAESKSAEVSSNEAQIITQTITQTVTVRPPAAEAYIEPVQEPKVLKEIEPEAEPVQQPSAKSVTATPSGAVEKTNIIMGTLNPGEDEHGGFRAISDFEFEDLGSLENLKNDLLNDFVRLIALMSDGQPNSLSVFYKPVDVDFPLLKAIAASASIKMTDVLAVAVPGSGGSDLKQLNGVATVMTRDGLLIFEGQGTQVDLKVNYSWLFMNENDWGLFSQDFGSGYYIAMIGDEATDVSLPGLTFDLRKNEDKLGAVRLYDFSHERFGQLMRSVSSIQALIEGNDGQDEESDDSLEVTYKYRIEMSGFGGEIVLGVVPRETYDYFKANQIDVADYIADSDSYSNIPAEHQFAEGGAWFEVDNIIHESGVELNSSCVIQVTDADGDEVWSSALDIETLINAGVTVNCLGDFYVHEQPDGTAVFMGQSTEKGTFFAAEFSSDEPFDPANLSLGYFDVDGWDISAAISYEGEDLDNEGGDTIGKGNNYNFTLIGEENEQAEDAAVLSHEDEGEEEHEEEEDDEIAMAARSFFAMYAFVTQYCDEDAERPIHLYMDDEDDGGEVSKALVTQLAPLFPNDRILAICEEDSGSGHGAGGELTSWNGLATVITNTGLYHVKSAGNGAYDLDGKTAYLSWAKLFGDCKAGLVIRSDVPDIWIGTSDTYLIKASYVDYSASISTWIYFDEFVKPELLERFSAFKQLALSRA
jgi:hypothetical protein